LGGGKKREVGPERATPRGEEKKEFCVSRTENPKDIRWIRGVATARENKKRGAKRD